MTDRATWATATGGSPTVGVVDGPPTLLRYARRVIRITSAGTAEVLFTWLTRPFRTSHTEGRCLRQFPFGPLRRAEPPVGIALYDPHLRCGFLWFCSQVGCVRKDSSLMARIFPLSKGLHCRRYTRPQRRQWQVSRAQHPVVGKKCLLGEGRDARRSPAGSSKRYMNWRQSCQGPSLFNLSVSESSPSGDLFRQNSGRLANLDASPDGGILPQSKVHDVRRFLCGR
ncbi:hypothetical protein OH77DRAFT_376942 [Trametes cingulata]|nr:hypothetical protein OH77DRAFT_376942 [Trametes cingulata]